MPYLEMQKSTQIGETKFENSERRVKINFKNIAKNESQDAHGAWRRIIIQKFWGK